MPTPNPASTITHRRNSPAEGVAATWGHSGKESDRNPQRQNDARRAEDAGNAGKRHENEYARDADQSQEEPQKRRYGKDQLTAHSG